MTRETGSRLFDGKQKIRDLQLFVSFQTKARLKEEGRERRNGINEN